MYFCVGLAARMNVERNRADGSWWITRAQGHRQTSSSRAADQETSTPRDRPRSCDNRASVKRKPFCRQNRKPVFGRSGCQ